MNFNLYKATVLLSLLFLSSFVVSCNSAPTREEEEAHEHAEENEENVTSLTPDQVKAAGIRLQPIENKNLTATIKANGSLRVPNKNRAHITTLYGGVIQSIRVELGDHVQKGQVIASIENPQFIQLQEDYLTTGSDIILAEQELDRQKALNEGNAGAKRNLQEATAKINTLRTRRAALQQQLQLVGINPTMVSNQNLRKVLQVYSPIKGTVSNVFAKIGSYVDVSSPIAEIVDNGELHLDLQIFEQDLPKIKVGQLISFAITNNPSVNYTARVDNIGSSFMNESKTIAVHSTIHGEKSGLIDGMNITALVSLEDTTQPAVANDAIVEADGKFYIIISSDNASFEKIEIIKGVTHMGYTAITPVKEIPANAQVVSKGAFFINAKMSDSGGHAH